MIAPPGKLAAHFYFLLVVNMMDVIGPFGKLQIRKQLL